MLFCLLTACYIKCPPAARFWATDIFWWHSRASRIYETRIKPFLKSTSACKQPQALSEIKCECGGLLDACALTVRKEGGKRRGFEMSPMPRDRLRDKRAPLGPPKISWAHQEREFLRRADILHKTSSLYKERGNYQTVCTSQGGNYLRERSEAVFCSRSSSTGLIAHLGWSPVLICLVSCDFVSLDLQRFPDTILWQTFVSINWGLYMKGGQLDELNFAMLLWHITF